MLLDSIVGKITVGILGCVGLLLCFAGHRLFPLGTYTCSIMISTFSVVFLWFLSLMAEFM